MKKLRTNTQLQQHVIKCVQQYFAKIDMNSITIQNEAIQDAHDHQTTIGWKNFIKGIWSDRWENV